jgi:hypothetical protein
VTFDDVYLPDFNGGSIDSCGVNICSQTVYKVTDVGGGGTGNSTTGDFNTYDLTEVAFYFPSAVNITSATLDPNGYETLLFGVTTASQSSAVPEPATWAMMLLGFAGFGLLGYRASRSNGPAPA